MYYFSRAVFVLHHHYLQGHTKGRCWSVSRCNNSRARCKFLFQTFGLSVVSLLTVSQNLAAETAAYLTSKHPDYAVLAARIAISNLHKETKKNFSQVVKDLYEYGEVIYRPDC
jgi:hypothetical protein